MWEREGKARGEGHSDRVAGASACMLVTCQGWYVTDRLCQGVSVDHEGRHLALRIHSLVLLRQLHTHKVIQKGKYTSVLELIVYMHTAPVARHPSPGSPPCIHILSLSTPELQYTQHAMQQGFQHASRLKEQ